MKRIVVIICIACFFLPVQAQESTELEVSTYYLIRHAEKVVSKTNRNPDLKVIGQARAESWAQVLKHVSLDAVYSTDYLRTKGTAQPTAEAQGLEVKLYHPINIDVEKFKEETKGQTVLIVGHSNTIPSFANKLIGEEKYKDIYESNNGNLYIVQVSESGITDMVLYIK